MIAASDAPTALSLLADGRAALEAAGRPDARPAAEWLLAAVLGTGRLDAYLDPGRAVAPAAARRYLSMVARRAAGEPLQHLLGFEDFHGLRLAVSPDALIPRPETEGLVRWALETLGSGDVAGRGAARLAADIGTGTGAIACALAASVPGLAVVAVDCSPAALAVAADNVRAHGLSDHVRLLEGDLVAPLAARGLSVDLVVANAPYLPTGLLSALPPEVALEPRVALDGGADGMDVIKRLVATAPAVLAPGAWLLLEIGEGQAEPLASFMTAAGYAGVGARRDLIGVERYIGARWSGQPGRADGAR